MGSCSKVPETRKSVDCLLWFVVTYLWCDGLCRTRIAAEAQHGLISQVLKDVIFSVRFRQGGTLLGETDLSSPSPKGMEGIVEAAITTTD